MMLKPVPHPDKPEKRRRRWRRRRLRSIPMAPTLLTLASICFGFGAMYCCAREMQDLGADRVASEVLTRHSQRLEDLAPTFLSIACWLLIGSMICDALDGRVARMTGQASDFGAQLDSLADVVSFGAAPAFLMVTMVHRELSEWSVPPLGFERFGQAAFLMGIIFVCCTALRLARFNVETGLEASAHEGFRGMPSPGAAGAVIAIIFLHEHIEHMYTSRFWEIMANGLTQLAPLATLVLALLMVSRVPYRHAVSSLLRQRPFGHVIAILLVLPLVFMFTEFVAFVAAWTFVLSGPIRYAFSKPSPAEDSAESPSETETQDSTTTRKAQ